MGKGIRQACKDRMPDSWRAIMKRNRCYCSFVEQVYRKYIPPNLKDKYHYKQAIIMIKSLYSTYSIQAICIAIELEEGLQFWSNIQEQVNNYEFNCQQMEKLFETVTWIKFNKPGLKEEVIKLGEESEDVDDFRQRLITKYGIDLTMAYQISQKFYKSKK